MTKLSRQNVGGIDYTMVGCTLTGVCASAASDYVKAVTLSDGDILADGMSVVITFANGNTAGTAPASLTIYSSDQVNYYSDSGLTQPFTLAPAGCYDIEYTGTGNAYTYTSYPVIQVEGVTAPVCNSRGKKTSGAAWDAGDAVLMLYSGGKFMIVSSLTNVITAGSKEAVTSGAVADAKYTYMLRKDLLEAGWYKIATFQRRNYGASISIDLITGYFNHTNGAHKVQINFGWQEAEVFDFAQDYSAVFDKIRICYNQNNIDNAAIYVHYSKNSQNPACININAGALLLIPINFETDSLTWEKTLEYNLGTNGLYPNGVLLDPVDYKCVHSIKVTYQQSRTIKFANWGFGLCMGNIDGSGNFCFAFSLSNGTFAINNWSTGTSFQVATLNENVIKVGNANSYCFTMTFNTDGTITFDWAGINNNTVFARIGFVGMSANGL